MRIKFFKMCLPTEHRCILNRTANRTERLINDAFCYQVMPGRKLHLSVFKGACRCEPWIGNDAGKKQKKGGGMFTLLIAHPLPAPSLSLLLLHLSNSLLRSPSHTHTEKNTHAPSHSQSASPISLIHLIKGSVISGAQSFLIEACTVCTILQLRQFGSQPRRAIDWDRTAVSSQFRESKWRKERQALCWFSFNFCDGR